MTNHVITQSFKVRESISVRANINKKNNKLYTRFNIGLDLGALLDIKAGTKIHMYIKKVTRDIIAIQKSSDDTGMTLAWPFGGLFIHTSFRWNFHENIKVDETIFLPYEITNDEILIVDIKPLEESQNDHI